MRTIGIPIATSPPTIIRPQQTFIASGAEGVGSLWRGKLSVLATTFFAKDSRPHLRTMPHEAAQNANADRRGAIGMTRARMGINGTSPLSTTQDDSPETTTISHGPLCRVANIRCGRSRHADVKSPANKAASVVSSINCRVVNRGSRMKVRAMLGLLYRF